MFKMCTVKQEWQLIWHGDNDFSINVKDASLYIPAHLAIFHVLFGKINLINGRLCHLG